MYITQGDSAAPSLIPTYTISGGTYTNSGYPTFGSYIQAQGYHFYDLTATPLETTNNSSSITSAMHTTFSGVITSEMQATMGTVNGVNLDTVLTGAQATYNDYMLPPSGVSMNPPSPAHNSGSLVPISFSGSNIQHGCTLIVVHPGGASYPYLINDAVATTGLIPVSIYLPAPGAYQIVVANPSQSSSTPLDITVTW